MDCRLVCGSVYQLSATDVNSHVQLEKFMLMFNKKEGNLNFWHVSDTRTFAYSPDISGIPAQYTVVKQIKCFCLLIR